MNAPASHTLPSHAERAEAFAASVRSALADLPADEVDELLDGLGADLEERLAEGRELGDPQQYAEELRTAAGLPPFDPSHRTQKRPTIREHIDATGHRMAAWLDETPGRRGFRDFMITLRPVWWVLRAVIVVWVLFAIVGYPSRSGVPTSAGGMLLTLATLVLSVQWGRGKWLPNKWIRGLRTAGNVGAALAVLPYLAVVTSGAGAPSDYSYEEPEPLLGLYSNGEQVQNIFAYDCDGNLIDLVRLYDQSGKPLDTAFTDPYGNFSQPEFWDDDQQTSYTYELNELAEDAEAWNAYPLTESENLLNGELGSPRTATPPREELAPLNRECQAQAADAAGERSDEADAKPKDADAKPTGPEANPTNAEAKP